jgi:hypothetical protein
MSLRAILFVLTTFLLLAPAPGRAIETVEVRFEPVSRVSGAALQLNGSGVRSSHSIRAYAIGLYLGATAIAWTVPWPLQVRSASKSCRC